MTKTVSLMTNEILDDPINSNFPKIRKSYSSALEFTILIVNGLFIVFGVFVCWSIAFSEGTWLFLINPTVFVLLFGIPPFHFVYQWRKASLSYDASKNVEGLKKLSDHMAPFLASVILGIWLLIFFFLHELFLSLFIGDDTTSYSLLLLRFIIFLFLVVLGPIQFFFIRRASKISKQFLT